MKRKIKIWFMKLKVRTMACYHIFFRNYDHWMILNLKRDQLIKLLDGKDFDMDLRYHGVQPYIVYRMSKMLSDQADEIDMALHKAKFEAEALKYSKSKSKPSK